MSNHTPGPWKVEDGQVKAGDRIVALVYSEDYEKHRWWWKCGDLNARLIAAAPDMLEALIEIFKGFENNWCLDWTKYQKIIERATGKSIEEASNK